jgi:hypothetical protein
MLLGVEGIYTNLLRLYYDDYETATLLKYAHAWSHDRSAILDVLLLFNMPPKRLRKKKLISPVPEDDIPQEGVVQGAKESEKQERSDFVVTVDVHREDSVEQDAEIVTVEDETNVTGVSVDSTQEATTAQAFDEGDSPKDSKKRKPRIVSYIFSDEQEKDICEWFKEEECLYNRRHKLYKDSQHKRRLYEEKASSLDPPCTCEFLLFATIHVRV